MRQLLRAVIIAGAMVTSVGAVASDTLALSLNKAHTVSWSLHKAHAGQTMSLNNDVPMNICYEKGNQEYMLVYTDIQTKHRLYKGLCLAVKGDPISINMEGSPGDKDTAAGTYIFLN